jgi:hydrogenase maturation protein HypF
VEAIGHYERLFDVESELIVHDLHPDYASTRYAMERNGTSRMLAVQHHHAHMASCMAEHGLNEPVIGVIFDGTGLGTDGAVWGGEFLLGDYADFRRAAHLRYVPMPGGEAAIREPWRMAAAYLWDAGVDLRLLPGISQISVKSARQLLERKVNSPLTSSMGRLFDAVAAMTSFRRRVTFEGQAAMELEWLATEAPYCGAYPFELVNSPRNGASSTSHPPSWQIDVRPMIRAIAEDLGRGISSPTIARRFHRAVVEMIVDMSLCIRKQSKIGAVVLSGGVFMNSLLTAETVPRLVEQGFRVYRHETVPPNDGGLCLGQLVIAAARQNGDNL